MVYFLEVSLLAKFIVSRSCFLGYDPCLVKLLLQDGELVGQRSIIAIDLGDLGQNRRKLIVGLVLVPLLLESLEGPSHAKLDEEVSNEFVALLASGPSLGSTSISGLLLSICRITEIY